MFFSIPWIASLPADTVFWCTKVEHFHEIQFVFSFVACTFGVLSKKSVPSPVSGSFCPMLFPKSLTILGL